MDQLTEEEARVAMNGAAEAVECPECGRTFPSIQAMRGHLATHRGAQANRSRPPAPPKPSPPTPPAPSVGQLLDSAGRAVVHKAVKNAKTAGNLISFGAPHLGLAIAGSDPKEQPAEWRLRNPDAIYVKSRAEMAGELILEIRDAERLRVILRILEVWNSLFEVSAAAELGGALVVATAVDVRVIPPDFKLQAGPVALPIAEATIGDVVAEWQRRGLYSEAGPGEAAGGGEHPPWPPPNAPRGAEVVQGGVENT